MSKKRWFALLIVAILFAVSIPINFLSLTAATNFERMFTAPEQTWDEKVLERGERREKIVVIDINGIIQDHVDTSPFLSTVTYRHRAFLRMLEHAGEDPTVEGIILRVNTPGGGVVESDEIHKKIIGIQEDYQKPIYVSMGSMAASGGYYIAAPADKIVAHPSTITGSLGVIMQSVNVAELAETLGVKAETIKSGPYKDIMSATREMAEEERMILQELINESYDQFVEVIATGREMSEEQVREIADGRIYSGQQAHRLGLVDEIGDMDDTIQLMIEEIGLGQLDVVRYEASFGFNTLFMKSAQRLLSTNDDLLGIRRLLHETNSPSLMYLYTK